MSMHDLDGNRSSALLWHLWETASNRLHAASALLDDGQELLIILSPQERAAYLLGHLLLQIRNGGWSQWVFNDYAVRLRETREAAAAIGTNFSKRVVRMLDKLEPLLEWDAEDGGRGGRGFVMTPKQQEDSDWDRPVVTAGEKLCEKLDDRFDDIDLTWEHEINVWLRNGAPGLMD